MPRYVVEVPRGVYDAEQAETVEWILRMAATRISSTSPVTYLRAEFLPSEERVLAWFDAADGDVVRRVAETAQVHGVAVSETISLEGIGGGEGEGGRAE